MKTLKDIAKRLALSLISQAQKMLLRSERKLAVDLYYRLAKLHFKIYFGVDLETEVLNASEIAHKASKRHSRLVLKVVYPGVEGTHKKIVKYGSRSTFTKNILLNAKL